VCSNATVIGSIPFTSSGSTSFIVGESYYAHNCSSIGDGSPTAFYEFRGTGECVVASLTSNFASAFGLYSGTCSDSACLLELEAGDDIISWNAERGTLYRLAVGGIRNGTTGDFTLALAPSASCPDVVTNDNCGAAKALNVSAFPLTELGSNALITSQAPEEARNCPIVGTSAKGAWYEIVGDGSCIRISDDLSDFDTILAVYVGPSCDELHCVNENIRSRFRDSTDIEINTIPGLTYYVFIAGQFGNTVEYGITFSQIDTCRKSSFCTLCADGNYPDRNLTWDGETSCSDLERVAANSDVNTESCTLARIIGAEGCGCPTNRNETGICTLCPDGSDPLKGNNTLFGNDLEPTCLSFSNIAAVEGNKTCELLQKRAFYCGCPGIEGCQFCSNGTETVNDLDLPRFIFQGNARYVCTVSIRLSADLF